MLWPCSWFPVYPLVPVVGVFATVSFCWDVCNLCISFAEIRNGSCLTWYQQIVKGTSVQVWRYISGTPFSPEMEFSGIVKLVWELQGRVLECKEREVKLQKYSVWYFILVSSDVFEVLNVTLVQYFKHLFDSTATKIMYEYIGWILKLFSSSVIILFSLLSYSFQLGFCFL